MDFAIFMPDWNSLDSVRRAHSDLEAAALVFFALLVLFDVLSHISEDRKRERLLEKIALCFFAVAVFAEIAAYPYGQRNDTLSEQVIRSLDTTARDAFTNASNALTKAGQANDKAEGAGRLADEALGKVDAANAAASTALTLARDARKEVVSVRTQTAQLAKKVADRNLTDEQIRRIGAKLRSFPGQEYEVVAYWDSKESKGIADKINTALQLAQWKYIPPQNWTSPFPGVVGVFVYFNPEADKPTQEAAQALAVALTVEGVHAEHKPQNPTNNPKNNRMKLIVGANR